ncbi:MAG: NAD(P)-dependent glycerol-3-phosphate dehydrogenase [Verrucomicrobia bacterium]|nr:NAD(P)-dependent glycerol-3-phosphate dehydrogenase [Verrucomicrobiota bacterium]
MRVAILGAGAWGTALGVVLARNGHPVRLWGHRPEHVAELAAARVNGRFLPGIPLAGDWSFEPDLDAAVAGSEVVVLAVPSKAFGEVAGHLVGFSGPVVSVTKGIEFTSGLTMTGILDTVASGLRTAALSGPSLALEVARGIPTAVVAASRDEAVSRLVQQLFHRPEFRVYRSSDLVGVELGGALKNVIAIAAGVCDGLGYGDNAKAALVTRGKSEMTRLGVACGARAGTFAGLGGLGDLVLTCFSKLSRNRGFGESVGHGRPVAEVLAESVSAVEGYPTSRSAWALAQRLGVEAPIFAEVYAMLHEGKDVRRAVHDLLSRDSKAED